MTFWGYFGLIIVLILGLYLLINYFIGDKNRNMSVNLLLIAGFIAIMILIMNSMPINTFFQTFLDASNAICVLALATTGIVLIFKTSTTTNFAQGSIATVGAFIASYIITSKFAVNISQLFSANMQRIALVFIGIITGALVAFILGMIIDVVIIRNARSVTIVGKQMITMGLVLVIAGIIPVVFGVTPYTIPRISTNINSFEVFSYGFTIPTHFVYSIIITILVLVILFMALNFTKWGLGVRATASNEVVASMMGVNTRIITAMSWAIAGSLGGLAAVLFAPDVQQLSVYLMTQVQVNGFMASIFGGFTSFTGPIVGSILIPLFSKLFSHFNSLWYNVVVYGIILIVVLIKPLGLFGKRIAKKV